MTAPVAVVGKERSEARRRPAGRKAMIVAAARRLAVDGGLTEVSMEDIASQLNITAGALYRHFPGKASIAEAVIADTMKCFVAAAEEARKGAVERGFAPARVLADMIASAVELGLDDPTLLWVQTCQWAAGGGAPATSAERRMARMWTAEVLAAMPDLPRTHARLRQAGVLGALAATTSRDDPAPRPALDVLLSVAATAVLLSPVVPGAPTTEDDPGRRYGGWRAEPTRRDQILAAALSLFRGKGFGGTTVDDIGRTVGMSGSGIYRTYQSKADILLDAYDRAAACVEVGTELALGSASDPLDALRRLTLSYATVVMDNTDLIVVTGRQSSALPVQERPRLVRRARAVRDTWVPVLRQARADLSEPEARLLYSGARALANHAALSSKRNQVEAGEIAALMLAFLLTVATDPQFADPKPPPG